MKRREFLAAAGAAATGALLSACGGPASAISSGNIPVYGTVLTWAPGFAKASRALKQASGYGLDAVPAPDLGAYEQVMKSRLETSQAPDAFKWWNGYRLQDTARTGQVADLTDLWNTAAKKDWVDTGVKDGLTYQGRVYGLPLTESYYVIFYSKKTFAKYGLRAPETWDEFESNAATLKKHGVIPFFGTQNGGWPALIWFQEFLTKLDPGFYERLTAGKASYTDATARQAMDIWRGFIEKGYFTSPDVDQANAPAMLNTGSVAMFPIGTWNNQSFPAVGMKGGVDYDAFIMPTVKPSVPKSVISEVATLVVPDRAPDKDATLKMLSHWLDPAVQKAWMSFLGDIPPNPTVPSADPVIQHVLAQVKANDPRLLIRFWEASPPSLIEGNVQDLGGFMINPNQVDSILAGMQRRADAEWAYWREEVA